MEKIEDIPRGFNELCIHDVWKEGWKRIDNIKVMMVRNDDRMRYDRKQAVTKFIIAKVKEVKNDLMMKPMGEEMDEVLENPWTNYVHSPHPSYYV